ncbi:hypothetical protein C2845_PM17G02700 [Panicum miliaceum]|uniref:Uncharacterized protein n=1 Tax=Panicum miliaceum TaxID=4540 RepID=A0A3L6Q578_PANMI|nr:hypothetical protein C2845_PM17G02700 [Panicum miliaceum]
MRPENDDEEFLHSIIHEGSQHPPSLKNDVPEDDGSQYLNDTGNGDAEKHEIDPAEVEAEVMLESWLTKSRKDDKTSTSRSLEAMEKRNYNMSCTLGSVGTSAT